METIEALRRQIEAAEGLHSVVRTMKVVSAASVRQYDDAVRSLGDYFRAVEMGFQILLRGPAGERIATPPATNPGGGVRAVVFGSAQGLCGRFNEQLVAFVGETLKDRGETASAVLAVGERVSGALQGAGHRVEGSRTMPGSIGGITPAVQELVPILLEWTRSDSSARILLFHHKPKGGTSFQPRVQQLVPLSSDWLHHLAHERWPTHVLPTHSSDTEALFGALVRQYIFVSLYRALAESLASENASRLTAMHAAEKHIDDRLEYLRGKFRTERQQQVTEEVLEVVSAYEASSGRQGR